MKLRDTYEVSIFSKFWIGLSAFSLMVAFSYLVDSVEPMPTYWFWFLLSITCAIVATYTTIEKGGVREWKIQNLRKRWKW